MGVEQGDGPVRAIRLEVSGGVSIAAIANRGSGGILSLLFSASISHQYRGCSSGTFEVTVREGNGGIIDLISGLPDSASN
jgi:hypothetical protein